MAARLGTVLRARAGSSMLGSARAVISTKALPRPMASYGFSAGSGTTSVDSSGNGRTLTLNSATWTAGHSGFGVTNSTTGTGASSAFTAPATAITLMAWIRPLSLTAGTTHFSTGFIDSGGNTAIAIFTQRHDFGTPNVLQCDLRLGGGLVAFHGPALTQNTWTHVAVTYNGATVVVYKDGVSVSSTSATGTLSPGDAFYVAGANVSAGYDTDVDIDDVRVFNSALSAKQVKWAMTMPVA